jgi:hypothetical protein
MEILCCRERCVFVIREDPYMHNPYTATDVEFEVASILYNIGALHSILGSMDSRTSAEVQQSRLFLFFPFSAGSPLKLNTTPMTFVMQCNV